MALPLQIRGKEADLLERPGFAVNLLEILRVFAAAACLQSYSLPLGNIPGTPSAVTLRACRVVNEANVTNFETESASDRSDGLCSYVTSITSREYIPKGFIKCHVETT